MPIAVIVIATAVALLVLFALALAAQCRLAFRRIARMNRGKYSGILSKNGVFGESPAGDGRTVSIGLMGDSLAAGLGADTVSSTPGAIIGSRLAEHLGRAVEVTNVAVAGSGAVDLARQRARLLARSRPDVVVIIVGANDTPSVHGLRLSARRLGEAVRELRAQGVDVVACTVPALGGVPGMPVPLRWALGYSARVLERHQKAEVTMTGAGMVVLSETAGPRFARNPELLSADRFHPSSAGYEVSCDAIIEQVTRVLYLRSKDALLAQH